MKALTSLMLVVAGTAAVILAGCGGDNGMMSRESALVARTVPSAGESAYDPAAPIHIKFDAAVDTARFHERFFFLDASMHDGMHDSLGQGMMSDSTMALCDSMARGMMGGGMGQMMGMMGGRHRDMDGNGHDSDMMDSMMLSMMGDYSHMADTALSALCGSMAGAMMGEGMDRMMGMMGGGHSNMNRGRPGLDMMNSMMMSMMDDNSHMSDTAAFYRGMHERRQRGQFQWNATLDSCVFTPDTPMMGDRDYVVMMRSMGQDMHNGHHGSTRNEDSEDMMIRFHTR